MTRERRALSAQGGAVARAGEPEVSEVLARILMGTDGPTDTLTHGFHAYPARMHPAIARAALAELCAPGAIVLDPFCGAGTVLVEARVAGRRSIGVDLNPLALRLAEVHCARVPPSERERFESIARRVGEASLARVRARQPARAPLSPRQRQSYAPHVLLELAGLAEEIGALADARVRRALEVVLSAMLVKFSRQRADTASEVADKRLRKGLASEFFVRKAHELAERWAALDAVLPVGAPRPQLLEGDARELPQLLGDARADLVVTSPPYGGTYDYHRHHVLRYPWLGLSSERFAEGEIGSRRKLSNAPQGVALWDAELFACLRSLRGAVQDKARIVLWLGDAEVSGRRVDAAQQIARLAPRAALALRAGASQVRRDQRGGRPRREHLLLLTPVTGTSS